MTLQQAIAFLMANNPRKIEGSELYGWQGLEGTGYIAEGEMGETVVLDVTDAGITIQHQPIDNAMSDDFTTFECPLEETL